MNDRKRIGEAASAPLLEAMEGYARGDRLGFHVPGHRKGKGIPAAFSRLAAEYGAALDLTELAGLDNLAAPTGCIEESQKEAARLAGSQYAYYLVNGATAGLEAAMMAMSGPDATTILPGHCHTAIYNGLILTGSMPLIMPCLMDEEWNLPLGPDRQAAMGWLAYNASPESGGGPPDRALWITVNPSYNGIMADLAWEKEMAGSRPGWRWLADEAHGVHLPFVNPDGADDKAFSALTFAADAVVQSAHKMGTGLTQTGLLHCNRPDLAGPMRQALNIMQSSSPSYLLMGSLDAWQAFLGENGRGELRRAEELALELAAGIRAAGGYRLWQDELPPGYRCDPRKITLSARDLGVSGFALAEILGREYGVDVELAAAQYILLTVGLGHDGADISRMIRALTKIRDDKDFFRDHSRRMGQGAKAGMNDAVGGAYSGLTKTGQKPRRPEISPREAFFRAREKVAIEDAEGRLAAVSVAPYPPGVPLLFPGMKISRGDVEAIAGLERAGLRCAGLEREGARSLIGVVAEK